MSYAIIERELRMGGVVVSGGWADEDGVAYEEASADVPGDEQVFEVLGYVVRTSTPLLGVKLK